ncbi:MAG: adenosine-specific kinase [Anaerolineae bacterium]|nr:adenosine-specific kinase [Anaerolineae bacterium]
MQLSLVPIEKPDPNLNLVLGQSHFIKSAEDIHEALVNAVPGIKFGLAFCEASGPRLVRTSGTDPDLVALAATNALAIGAGHTFIVLLGNAFPINVVNTILAVPEVVGLFCATANPVQVVVAESELGRGVLGVIDGQPPLGVEDDAAKAHRHDFLRKIGYKF